MVKHAQTHKHIHMLKHTHTHTHTSSQTHTCAYLIFIWLLPDVLTDSILCVVLCYFFVPDEMKTLKAKKDYNLPALISSILMGSLWLSICKLRDSISVYILIFLSSKPHLYWTKMIWLEAIFFLSTKIPTDVNMTMGKRAVVIQELVQKCASDS